MVLVNIAVFGVSIMNGTVQVSFINELRKKGFTVSEAVIPGAKFRLRPVTKTASIAILCLVPMMVPVIYEWIETRTERPAEAEK